MRIRHTLLILTLLVLGGCASSQKVDDQVNSNGDPRDPIESFNRSMWTFNWDYLDQYLLRPAAVAYRDYVPHFARKGLYNAALNLEEPSNTINNLLQGNIDGTFISLGRFILNSTFGLLGTIDLASEVGMERHEEEFGEVLAVWGVDTGPYLMIPAMGPNDVRSGTGDIVDSAYFPLDNLNVYTSILRATIKALESRADLIAQEDLLENSLDPYVFVKDAYFQNLENKVNNGEVAEPTEEEEALDDELDDYLEDL